MKTISARIPMGRTSVIQKIELYTVSEAKELLFGVLDGKGWDIGIDVYSVDKPNERIGWLADFGDGSGIYVESKA